MNAARLRTLAGSLLALAILFSFANVSPATAQLRRSFRVTSLAVQDPQIYHTLNGCNAAINGLINAAINAQFLNVCEPVTEGVPDPCTFALNLVAVFDPLVQTAGQTTALVDCMSSGMPCELDFASFSECTRTGGASGSTACTGDASFVFPTTYSTGGFVGGVGAICLEGIPGTFGANNLGVNPKPTPAVATAAGNCAVSGLIELNLEVGDGLINIPLKSARLGARFVNDPATSLASGLARGFLSEAAAAEIMIDIDTPIMIHGTLASLLAGGAGNCKATQDDRDYNPPGDTNGERGWWFYLQFSAGIVTAPEFPTPTASATMPQGDTPTPTPQPTNTPVNTNTAVPPTNTPVPPTNTPEPPTSTPVTPTSTPVTPTNTPIPPTATPTNTVAAMECPGDCDGDGEVAINEVQRVANIYLGIQDVGLCSVADRNDDGEVTIDEVVFASRRYQLDDCASL